MLRFCKGVDLRCQDLIEVFDVGRWAAGRAVK